MMQKSKEGNTLERAAEEFWNFRKKSEKFWEQK